MRCGCPACGAYMAHSEGLELGCVCPECNNRCKLCLGADTAVISRDKLLMRREQLFAAGGDNALDEAGEDNHEQQTYRD